jgi:hypothetical protein
VIRPVATGVDPADAASRRRGDCYGHGGFWGSLTVYCPRRKLAISVSVSAASPGDPEAVVQRLAEIAG